MDSRRFQRTVVDREVECEIDGIRDFVYVYNISVSGCMIEITNSPAEIGSLVTLHLAGLSEVRGRIVWHIGHNAGLQFDSLIPESFVHYLGFDPGPLTFAEVQPRDRYGCVLLATH